MKYYLQILSIGAVATLSACSSGSSSSTSVVDSPSWSWQGGSNESDAYGIYGTLGVASTGNVPGARLGSISWMDNNGNLWLFGGAGNSATDNGRLNDLWEYSPATSKWTWVGGSNSNNALSVYGSKNVTLPSNMPGARDGGVSWRDANGKLWMFGGQGKGVGDTAVGFLNDMWEYDPGTNEWTWRHGMDTILSEAHYGRKGIPTDLNTPGGRIGATSWTDSSGNLWMFGGTMVPDKKGFNDLWKYNPNTNQWTWMNGESTTNASGVYGAKGLGLPANHPGARYDAINWVDNHGNFWIFGGIGLDGENNFGLLNDLWKYDSTTDVWTWINGSTLRNQYGTYGALGVATVDNTPGGREHRNPFAWADENGNLWMLGGFGLGKSSTGILNDLWTYNPAQNQWAWVGGSSESNMVGNYNSSTKFPGARRDAIGWVDNNNNLWVFGGKGNGATTYGNLNDLWKYNGIVNQTPFPVMQYITFPSYESLPSNYITGVRGITNSSNVFLSVIWPSTSASLGLIYTGPLNGIGGQWHQINYESSFGSTIKSMTWYGPNNGANAGEISVVGSYTTVESGTTSFGIMYRGALTDGANLNNWTRINPPGSVSTIAHSNMGDLVVGNYNENNLAGKGFVYNIKTGNYFTPEKQGAASLTIYGIWYNGGTSYTIAGGYSNLNIQGADIGYIADFDSSNNALTNFTSYSYNNQPIDSIVSHFEGITGNGANGYNLIADTGALGSLSKGVQPAFVQITRLGASFSPVAKWTDLFYPGAKLASGNTVFENNALGVYSFVGPDDVSSFIATVPVSR